MGTLRTFSELRPKRSLETRGQGGWQRETANGRISTGSSSEAVTIQSWPSLLLLVSAEEPPELCIQTVGYSTWPKALSQLSLCYMYSLDTMTSTSKCFMMMLSIADLWTRLWEGSGVPLMPSTVCPNICTDLFEGIHHFVNTVRLPG